MVTTEQIKELRGKTGVSIMQCRKALVEANGDMDKAAFLLRKHSGDIARKKEGRELNAGIVHSYIHSSGTLGAIVEVNCESDFVARNPEFKTLAFEMAMQVAAANPEYLEFKDVPEEAKKDIEALFSDEIKKTGKPEVIQLKMLEGKMSAYFKEKCLLDQPYIKNPETTIADVIKEHVQKFGEKIAVARFARYSVLGK